MSVLEIGIPGVGSREHVERRGIVFVHHGDGLPRIT